MIANYVMDRRWFRAKARGLVDATIEESFPLQLDGDEVTLAIVTCTYADGGSDRYVLPIAIATGDEAARLWAEEPHLVIGNATSEMLSALGRASAAKPNDVVYDALGNARLLAALLNEFGGGGRRVTGQHGTLVFRPLPGFDAAIALPDADVTPRPTKTEQTNTSIVFGNTFILKIVRQLDEGTSAELEMGAFLTEHGYGSSPQVVGAIEIERPGKEPSTVGVVHRFVANRGDAWTFTLNELARSRSPATYRQHAELLGKRVGEMHVVLAAGTEPTFVVERLEKKSRTALAEAVKAQARSLAAQLRNGDEAKIAARAEAFISLGEDPPLMRIHGDLHLGQILATDDDFILIDFEGEPARPLAVRRAKRAPFADVAGMLRSFDYAAASVQRAPGAAWSGDEARAWYRAAADTFLAAYRSATHACNALQTADDTFWKSLDFYLLEKCLYELAYEVNNRPDWIAIPQSGIRNLLDGGART